MPIRRYPNGDLLAPARAEGPGGWIGDGVERIRRGTARWRWWERYLAAAGQTADPVDETPPG